jgi:hypothetical protein
MQGATSCSRPSRNQERGPAGLTRRSLGGTSGILNRIYRAIAREIIRRAARYGIDPPYRANAAATRLAMPPFFFHFPRVAGGVAHREGRRQPKKPASIC